METPASADLFTIGVRAVIRKANRAKEDHAEVLVYGVERVVLVELNPKASQAQLLAAIEPVADRLLKRDGAMLAGLNAYRRALLKEKPHLKDVIRNIGRGHELPD